MRPNPPRHSPVTSSLYSHEFPLVETPQLSPARSRALVISLCPAAPPDPLGAGGDRPVSGIEPSLTAHIQRTPDNACLYDPDSACLGAPAHGVSLPDYAARSTLKFCVRGGRVASR